jgi:hypothetical protein
VAEGCRPETFRKARDSGEQRLEVPGQGSSAGDVRRRKATACSAGGRITQIPPHVNTWVSMADLCWHRLVLSEVGRFLPGT